MVPAVIPMAFSHSREFHPGDIVDGRYRVLRKLADGGMGAVFLAEHMLIKRRVAIKLLHAELAEDRGMVERFLKEATAAGTLGHPHIVESTDMGFTRDQLPYIVFEYLEGCLLVEEIQRIGRLPERRALVIARQIASALEAAHTAGIAHLDLKSDNVFLTDRPDAIDHAVLFDFGISRFMATDSEASQPGVLMGTPEFMAPEQVASPDLADCRTDIYALGVMLYEMLTGRCPFTAEEPRAVLRKILHDAPPPFVHPVSPGLERLVFGGLLVKSRDHRMQTMTQVTDALDELIAEFRPSVPPALVSFDDPDRTIGWTGWAVDQEDDAAIDRTIDGAIDRWLDEQTAPLDAPIGRREAAEWEFEIWP